MKVVCCLFAILLAYVSAYPEGAPAGQCVEMTPGHNANQADNSGDPIPAQTEDFPFNIITNVNCYNAGSTVHVRIVRKDTCPPYGIEGIFVQARTGVDNANAHGTFTADADQMLKTVDCNLEDGTVATANAITHSEKIEVANSVTFTWTAPADAADGSPMLYFVATVVSEFDEFWVKQMSDAISYMETCESMDLPPDSTCAQEEHSSHEGGESSPEAGDTAAILSANMAVSVLALMAAILYTFFN